VEGLAVIDLGIDRVGRRLAAQVREGGVDGLIASLSEKNRLLIALLLALQGAPVK